MRRSKRKRVTNFNINEKVVTKTGDSYPLAEDELSLYGVSDLDEQIDRLRRPTIVMLIFTNNNDESEPEESDEDDLMKDIANKAGPPIKKNLANMINNVTQLIGKNWFKN